MNIESEIIATVVKAVKECYGQDVPTTMVQLQKTKAEFEGNLTLVVFPFLKVSKLKPEDTAQQLGEYLAQHCKVVQSFNVVKGFLNITIASAAWISLLNRIDSNPIFGQKTANEQSPLVMIEYSSPNTNKPLHLGHVRNNLLGWSLAKIMEANGNRVVKTNIVNDRGIHICKWILEKVGQWRHTRKHWQERRPPYWRLLRGIRPTLPCRTGRTNSQIQSSRPER